MTLVVKYKRCVYHCISCKSTRQVQLNVNDHLNRVSSASNDLAMYSDIHICYDGILGINNLYIDQNFSVRSFSVLELPSTRTQLKGLGSIPIPQNQKPINTYNVTQMAIGGGYRLILQDESLGIVINVGEVDAITEQFEAELVSKNGNIILEYYSCKFKWSSRAKDWFQAVIDALESLPPTRLGLFIETLRFVLAHHHSPLTEFEIEQLKTILLSHQTFIRSIYMGPRYKRVKQVTNKYGLDKKEVVNTILAKLSEKEQVSFQHLIEEIDRELVYLIYILIILENELIVKIERNFDY